MRATPTWAARFSARCSNGRERNRAMSRVGKKPVVIPSGVNASVEGQLVKVKGPKGALQLMLHDDVSAKVEDGSVKVDPKIGDQARARHVGHLPLAGRQSGRGRDQGVRAQAGNLRRRLSCGAAGQEPADSARLQPRHCLSGARGHHDRAAEGRPRWSSPASISQKVGQVAAEIRAFRKPEPYKGKGVKYSDEFIFRKEGKKK